MAAAMRRRRNLTSVKRKHCADDSDSTWEEQDPGDLSDFVGKKPKTKPISAVPPSDHIKLGRVTRKPTDPNPVFVPRKKSKEDEAQVKKTKGTSTITAPECTTSPVTSSAPILHQTLPDTDNNLKQAVSSDASSSIKSLVSSFAGRSSCISFGDYVQCNFPPLFRSSSIDASSQTNTPQRHHNRRRCTRTEHNGCVKEVVSEEEWWDY